MVRRRHWWLWAALLLLVPTLVSPAAAAPTGDSVFDARIARIREQLVTDPPAGLRQTAALATQVPKLDAGRRTPALAAVDWLRAEALLRTNQTKPALDVAAHGLALLKALPVETKLHGDLLIAHGGAAAASGDVQRALEDYQRAHRIFGQVREARGQAVSLLNIAAIYRDASDYERALSYDDQALDAYSQDAALRLTAYNNRGNALMLIGRAKEAEQAFTSALAAARTLDSDLMEVRVLQNLARSQADLREYDAAEATLSEAYRLAETGPAARVRPAIDGVGAMIALRRGQLPRAAALIDRAFAQSESVQATMPLKDLHLTAYEIFKARGENAKALAHLELFKQLDDEARALAASTNAALMRARFDFANQDAKIAQAQARLRITIVGGFLIAAAVVSTLLAIGFFSIRRSRNQVRAANRELTAANAELAKALAAKTEFLATTSHEIRTPLNGILGMTQVMLTDRTLSQSLRSRIELVHGAGETMRALVDDILDVAKMETGELRIHPAEMNLTRLLEETAAVWAGQAETKRIGIVLDIADAPARIVADEVRLRQIVFNLISNAIKFTDRGQVRLAVRTQTAGDSDERLLITIEDSGIGIPADRLQDIFESFRQVDGGTTRRHGGTGLGLAICRNLARAMGGDVSVTSELGMGSRFTVELPLVRVAEPAALPADRPEANSLEAAELLLVEANPLSQGVLRALIAPHVAQLRIASGVDEVPAALAEGTTHVVADAGTLGLDLAAAEKLAADAAAVGARTTILWSTPDEAVTTALANRAVQLIAKPISPPDLLAALRMGYLPSVASRDVAA